MTLSIDEFVIMAMKMIYYNNFVTCVALGGGDGEWVAVFFADPFGNKLCNVDFLSSMKVFFLELGHFQAGLQ